MYSHTSPNSSLIFAGDPPSVLRRSFHLSSFAFPNSIILNCSRKPTRVLLSVSGSVVECNHRDIEWGSLEPYSADDDYGGWAVSETPYPPQNKRNGLRKIVIGSVGSAIAVLLAGLAYFSVSRKGFRVQLSSPLRGVLSWPHDDKSETAHSVGSGEKNTVSEISSELLDADNEPSASTKKVQRVIISVAADITQQEALEVLKKLKIIVEDVRADEFCTKREYARWLVRTNSLLERSPRHRIVPSVALAGSLVPAFDDVNVEDPDFEYIQALAEAGIIRSKLSQSDESNCHGSLNFCPESSVSRQDLISWKAQVDYDYPPGSMEEISRTKVDYIDAKEVDPDVAAELIMDTLAGDKSTIRKVFGKIKRFQPNKPATKAQAAVALTSGRMVEAISAELSKIETENLSRQAVMDIIRSELLEKGDIKRFWDGKLQEEMVRGLELENLLRAKLCELEQEKIAQEMWFTEQLKEKAAIDCQKQLLSSLETEVNEMSERVASEKSAYLAERSKLDDILRNLQSKLDTLVDKKSILEAEVEALRILRSWIEDEAKTSQARAKVLEEVGRRWKWEDQS